MVDFQFDLKPWFPTEIRKISANDFDDNMKQLRDQQTNKNLFEIAKIIDTMGKLSAMAQNLKMPITSFEKLKSAQNHKLYLMSELNNNSNTNNTGKDVVVGLLKVGKKDLFLYDECKEQRKFAQVPCILDFYIHESRQRCGYGKKLFEKMLVEENWNPIKCTIDRPSHKLMGFLKKHYGLELTIPQAYNFVLYKGFFDDANKIANQKDSMKNAFISKSKSDSKGNRADDNWYCKTSGNFFNEGVFNGVTPSRYKDGFKVKKSSISIEHFGGCNSLWNLSIPRQYSAGRSYSMAEIKQ